MTRLALPPVVQPDHVAKVMHDHPMASLRVQVGLRWGRPHYLNSRQIHALQHELRALDGDAWCLMVFRDGVRCMDGPDPTYWRKPLIELTPFVHRVYETVRGPMRGFWVPTGWRDADPEDPPPTPLGYPADWGLPWGVLEEDPPPEDWFSWSPV